MDSPAAFILWRAKQKGGVLEGRRHPDITESEDECLKSAGVGTAYTSGGGPVSSDSEECLRRSRASN
eukprot:10682260-Alexandrium_andersonii.AAC.1